ncbi:MAG: transposase, partial [Cenarchaeum sp. SB0661_bin_35]|nr:transposase [Cenarchaeum sp. SB0666_bin_15]MYC80023.1 transposase [Cenarchaeum sp. SB0661_bin_35]MYG33588.1 transposase [Cenarchaeum sp. SB0677_bin_16]
MHAAIKREGEQLLTFLKHKGVPYHNNTSERALRIFALM